jgi:DNA-binding NarL/FixJ family response regulator
MFHERSEALRHQIWELREQSHAATSALRRRSRRIGELAIRSIALHSRSLAAMDAVRLAQVGSGAAESSVPRLSRGLTTRARAPRAHAPLRARELEVAALVAEGLTNGEIARRLQVATGAVANHLRCIMLRLGARGRVDVAR